MKEGDTTSGQSTRWTKCRAGGTEATHRSPIKSRLSRWSLAFSASCKRQHGTISQSRGARWAMRAAGCPLPFFLSSRPGLAGR